MTALMIILTILILLDAISTGLVLADGGWERNPFLRWMMRNAAWPWGVLLTLDMIFLIVLWVVRPEAIVLVLLIGAYHHAVDNNTFNWLSKRARLAIRHCSFGWSRTRGWPWRTTPTAAGYGPAQPARATRP